MRDFITTIDSDDESVQGESSRMARAATPAQNDMNPEFNFDADGGRTQGLDLWAEDEVKGGPQGVEIDDIIERRTGVRPQALMDRKHKKRQRDQEDEGQADSDVDMNDEDDELGANGDTEDDEDEDGDEESDDDEDGEERSDAAEDEEDSDGAVSEPADDDESDSDAESVLDEAEEARKDAFFDDAKEEVDPTLPSSFAAMNLSRPILRALSALSLNTPTPIQARAIPLALLGRDVLGSAVTGSGKTAAFMIPILERLCYRDRSNAGQATRVLVLCPTRELAVQCEAVGKAITTHSGLDIRFALLVGGLSLNAQAHALRTLPDVLIATPGRLIDHLHNTPSFTLSALDILVIDEADRMLETGFTDELEEIIKACPRSRQTMLFSATMTDSVDELVKLSLDKPIRVFVDKKRSTAKGLIQEFVRVRSDDSRTPALLALCRTFQHRCIIFFRSKALAHQMRVVFGLCGYKAAELHGNLTQEQRLSALTSFKAGKVDFLLATDLASRGLDIKGVETVINYDMPGQLAQYTHRVGRTARAGRKGRSITLVGEADRKMLKAAIKQSPADQIRHRVIPAEVISALAAKIDGLKDEIHQVLFEEKEEKAIRTAEMQLRKGQNMVEHEAEIFSRPARTWFQTEKEKQAAKQASKPVQPDAKTAAAPKIKRDKYDGLSRKLKRRKMAAEEDEKDTRAAAAIRAAKKTARPVKITQALPQAAGRKGSKSGKSSKSKKGSAFEQDKGARGGGGSREGMRAKPVKVNLGKKKK